MNEEQKLKQKEASKKYQNKLKINYECRKQGIPEKYIIRKKRKIETINIEIVDKSSVNIGFNNGELKSI